MTKLVAITVAALLFRRHDISTGGDPLMVITTRQDVKEEAYGNQQMKFSDITHALGAWVDPFDPPEGYLPGYATLMRRIEIDKGEHHILSQPPGPPDDNIFRTDTNELEWHYDPDHIDDSYVKVDTEKVHVLAGKIDTDDPHTFSRGVLAGGSILVDAMTTSALIAMILKEETDSYNSYLIIATGKMENNEQEIDPILPAPPHPNPPLYMWHNPDFWGDDPVWVEGIDAHITLPVPAGNVDFFILNPDGSEYIGIDPEPQGDHCILHLSQNNQTLWYKLVINL